ncbi:hypothetical protein ABFS83_13G102500 [Erythranthe nasuta]
MIMNNNSREEEEDMLSLQIVSKENCSIGQQHTSSSSSSIICPSCGKTVILHDHNQTGLQDLPGLPAGVKFDPSDQEILQHLEAKVLCDAEKLHPLIDKFIPTIEGDNGICYTHPEKLPGVNKEGQVRHFFHRPSKAYTTGTRKRRKVNAEADGSETRWHKTGKTRPVSTHCNNIRGYKKILVLYTNYGRQRKPEKTNWVMHQYHLGDNEEEKEGELVVSKVFYQTQPRQCGSSNIVKEATIDRSCFEKNASFVEYYNNNNNSSFISYNEEEQNTNRDRASTMIPNLVDGSSFIHLPSNASKGK